MGLKFRRGTTAQKSGSLAFGEPYVNTTLGTLQVGGPDGDITLGSSGTGSTGNFGAISGSGLDITGNANIGGNLSVGGQLTIGDNTSDTVNVVASLSSSLIPSIDSVFDLGSVTKIWRDLYISTGSIKVVSNGAVVSTLSTNGDGSQNFPNGIRGTGGSGYIQTDAGFRIKHGSQTSETGYLGIGADFDRVVLSTSGGAYSQHLIFPNNGIRLYTYPTTDGTIALTSDLTSGTTSVSNLNSFSSSALGRFTNLETTSASVNTSIANLNTTTASLLIETANLELFSGSALGRLSNLETTSASLLIETANLESFTSSINTTIKSKLNADGVISGSSQVSLGSASGNIALATQTTGNYVASLVEGTGVTITNNSGENATPTIAIGQAVATTSNVRFGSIGVGMDASGTSGRIDAANDVVAFSTSDIRLKENIKPIENALDKISKISGNTYDWKSELKDVHGYDGSDVGVIAQEIEAVLPQLVQDRDNGYKAVKYDKIVALLIEGIKEQQTQIHSLTLEIEKLKEQKGL